MARVGMESKIQFQLLVGNLKSQFMYSIKPLAYKDTFAKMTKFLTDSFFGAKSFGKALESLKSDPVLNVLIMQIYLNQYVMYNDGDTKVIQELESKLIKTIDTVGFKLMSSFEKKIAIEYVKNTPSFPSLQINSNHSPQHILKNLCILSMVNLVICCQNGLHCIFFNKEGTLRSPSEIEQLSVPGSFSQIIMNYLYMLDLPVQWRNYDDSYTNTTHLLLECKKCGNLNLMFACNNPERVVQCNPPTCNVGVDFLYVKENHIDNMKEELPKRIKQRLPSHKGLMIFNMAESKKTTMVGKCPMLTIKVIHLIYWSFLSVAVEIDPRYKEFVKKLFEMEKENMGLLREKLSARINDYFSGIKSDIKCQQSDEYIWVNGVVMEMVEADKIMTKSLVKFEERESFEVSLTKILEKHLEGEDSINKWKAGFKNENVSEEVVRLIEDSDRDKESQIYQALTQDIEIEDVQLSSIQAKILDDNKRAPFTVMIFSHEDDYRSLMFLKPLVDFYMKMLGKYKLQINTREAGSKTIEEYISLGKKTLDVLSSKKTSKNSKDFGMMQISMTFTLGTST
jgi:hypothetical protein